MPELTPWQILVVDDEALMREQIEEYLSGVALSDDDTGVEVTALASFDDALAELARRRYDVVVLDVRLGSRNHREDPEEEAGIRVLEQIREQRFVPVIFYTGVPQQVRHLAGALIRVVEKSETLVRLAEEMRGIFDTRLPAVNRALLRHLEAVQRDYMWDFVAAHWGQFGASPNPIDLAYLLARRLATSLSGSGIRRLVADLGGASAIVDDAGSAVPMQYYVLPAVAGLPPRAGDLFRATIDARQGYWLLLTPSCDMVPDQLRAEWVLLAYCAPLETMEEYRRWDESRRASGGQAARAKRDALERLIRNGGKERYYFLPAALTLPNMVVDFQQLASVPCPWLDANDPVASLDSPFAQEALVRFSRYFGRLGTPDLAAAALVDAL